MRNILVSVVLLVTFLIISLFTWLRYTRRVAEIPAYLDSYWDVLKERRRSVRLNKRLPVTCTVAEKDGSIHHIFSKNISGEGVCLKVPEILPEGSPLDLTIMIPNDKPVSVTGEIVWVGKSEAEGSQAERVFDVGIKFTKTTQKDLARLKQFLASSLKEREG